MSEDNQLHLPDLTIEGFRGIDSLTIPRLGRVTLIAGENGIGKTTILEAVRVYAARGHRFVLESVLEKHEEVISVLDEENDEDGASFVGPNFVSLFYGRNSTKDIVIGNRGIHTSLSIGIGSVDEVGGDFWADFDKFVPIYEDLQVLRVNFRGETQWIPWISASLETSRYAPSATFRARRLHSDLGRSMNDTEPWQRIKCESLGPDLPDNRDIARFWKAIALTDDEFSAVDALGIIAGKKVDRIAVISDPRRLPRSQNSRVIVRFEDTSTPVPLRSIGDGAPRLFSIALALINSRNGFLLIDEAENGIHYSVQNDFWRMVLHIAHEYNVQVLATTHSWDCVKGFAQAADENKAVEGVYFRLERDEEGLYTVDYPEGDLKVATEHGTETR